MTKPKRGTGVAVAVTLMAVVLAALLVLWVARVAGAKRKPPRAGSSIRLTPQSYFALPEIPDFAVDWAQASRSSAERVTVLDDMVVGSNMTVGGDTAANVIRASGVILRGAGTKPPPTNDSVATGAYLTNPSPLPVPGMIVAWSDTNRVPGNRWVLCDGQTKELTDENGRVITVTPPDLTHMFIRGVGSDADVGKTGGQARQFLGPEHLISHNHTMTAASFPSPVRATTTSADHQHTHSISNLYSVPIATQRGVPNASDIVILNEDKDPDSNVRRAVAEHPGSIGGSFRNVTSHDHHCDYTHVHRLQQDGQAATIDIRPKRFVVSYYMYT